MQLAGKILSFLGAAVLALFLFSCAAATPHATSLNAERPKDEAFRTETKRELSSLNIGIEASAKELSDNLNRLLPRELYRGSTKTRGLTADILRNGPVALSAADNCLYLTLPVAMALSFGSFETPAIATKLKFRLNARVTPDWKIDADVHYLGLSDLMAEEVGVGPFSIKPRSIVDGITQPLQQALSGQINRKLNEKFPLRAQVAKVWSAARNPILLDKNYSAWLKLAPQEVLIYPLYASSNQVKLCLGLKSYAEMAVGPKPPAQAAPPLPRLKQANGMDRTFRVALNTDLFYRDILSIATPLLLNRELGSDGKSVILKDLDLYGNGDRLMIRVQTAGSLDGTFYLTCRPAFNAQTNAFSIEDVDFDMETRSLLLKTADWFLHGTIRETIREKLNMDLTQRLAQARDMAGSALARVNLAENAYLTGNIKRLKLNDVVVQRDRLSIQLYTEGETAIVFH
ncbi:MAG TPA: DUF4403 family protein [Geobacteraceae bacterium]